jgi:thiol-disulfide isomerase/thioredoxin
MTIATVLIALIATPGGDASSEPVLLDFHTSWCGPCKQMRPAIELLIQKGYRVKSVDADHEADLAERYHVSSVPTFIVIDSEGRSLARTSGAQPAAQLAKMYLEAKTKLKASASREPRDQDEDERDGDRDRDQDQDRADSAPADADRGETADERPAPSVTNPKPWETGVRIKVHGQGSIGFGSGTIIYSTAEESIILTCAHIFKLEGQQSPPARSFPRRISVDLFDGKLSGQKPAQVHWTNETLEGKAIDYDFSRDVGLIRIRPGRKLPSSRVVPTWWKPKAQMIMTTVGCSEGHDATAWNTTIVNPSMHGLSGNPKYEAIECVTAPKQGRSGGGLYTSDGYVAGVCDFAEPRGNHGLYATPTSIHYMLEKNNLTVCYAPVGRKGNDSSQAHLANNRGGTRRKTEPAIARAQSPDRDESNDVMIPPPELLGIKSPANDGPTRTADSGTRTSSSSGWHAPPSPKVASRTPDREREGQARRAELTLGSEFDNDRFGSMPADDDAVADARDEEPAPVRQTQVQKGSSSRWRPVRSPLPELSSTR